MVGADYLSSVFKLATFLLSLVLVQLTRDAGRVTSPVQSFFWIIQTIALGFTFGSVVNPRFEDLDRHEVQVRE